MRDRVSMDDIAERSSIEGAYMLSCCYTYTYESILFKEQSEMIEKSERRERESML